MNLLASLASIPLADTPTTETNPLPESKLPDYPKTNFNSTESSGKNISEKLEGTLFHTAPFLRDVFTEFSHILSKTLVGSHGQELLPNGLHALKPTASVVELVMLLCSQEWQNSLQVKIILKKNENKRNISILETRWSRIYRIDQRRSIVVTRE